MNSNCFFVLARSILTVCFIIIITFAPHSETFAQTTERNLETKFVNRLASELIRTNRPIEYALALAAVQERLELSDSRRQALIQTFAKADSAIAQSHEEYLTSLSTLKADFERDLRNELNAWLVEEMRRLLKGADAEQDHVPPEVFKSSDNIPFRNLWQRKDNSLIPIAGLPSQLKPVDQWWIPNLSAKESVKQAGRHLRYSITNQLSLDDRQVFAAISLTESQLDDLNRSLDAAAGKAVDLPRSWGSGNRRASSIEYHLMLQDRNMTRALKRDDTFRRWAKQNLTQPQIDTLLALYLQCFEQQCPSASVWCLIDLVVDLSNDQTDFFNDRRHDFLEAEESLWLLHVDRCRSAISKSYQVAITSLDRNELTEFNRLFRLLTDRPSPSAIHSMLTLMESMGKKSK